MKLNFLINSFANLTQKSFFQEFQHSFHYICIFFLIFLRILCVFSNFTKGRSFFQYLTYLFIHIFLTVNLRDYRMTFQGLSFLIYGINCVLVCLLFVYNSLFSVQKFLGAPAFGFLEGSFILSSPLTSSSFIFNFFWERSYFICMFCLRVLSFGIHLEFLGRFLGNKLI